MSFIHYSYLEYTKDSIEYVEQAKSPRIIKTHLPISMLPPNLLDTAKVVVVARNVKDVCVSFYHMEQMSPNLGLPKETCFDDYVDVFMSGQPAVYGNYWAHLKVFQYVRYHFHHAYLILSLCLSYHCSYVPSCF